jgi:hypothetical protein
MPQVGFEHTTTVFERAKTVHALDRSTNVIDGCMLHAPHISFFLIDRCAHHNGRAV